MIESILSAIKDYFLDEHSDLFVSYDKEKFIGCKFKKSDRYYILFVSKNLSKLTLSYRYDINNIDVNREVIEGLSIEEIINKINDILEKVIADYKELLSTENNQIVDNNQTVENFENRKTLIDKVIELEKTFDVNKINSEFSNIKVDDLTLRERLYNVLKNNNIETLADILLTPMETFNTFSNCGRTTLKEICSIKLLYINGSLNDIKLFKLDERFCDFTTYKIDVEFTEEQYDKYLNFGIEIGIETTEILENTLTEKELNIFKMRMGMIDLESSSMQSIGDELGLTRERIRQILLKINRKIKNVTIPLRSKYSKYFNEISNEELLNYLLIGIQNTYNFEFLKFVLETLDPDFANSIMNIINELYWEAKSEEEKEYKIDDIKYKILSKINIPGKLCDNAKERFDELTIQRVTNDYNNNGMIHVDDLDTDVEYESLTEKTIIDKLTKYNFIEGIKTQSLVIDYEYNGKECKYYPDIQLLYDDKLIIIEVKPFSYMATSYNLTKYMALKKYCINNGFCYLMIDSKYRVFDDLYNINVPKELEAEFFSYLMEVGIMDYGQFKEFSENNFMTLDQVGKIVLDNPNLIEFNIKPFSIRMK